MIFGLLVGLAGGIAGLWASCGRNTLAAKLLFWSWPASLATSTFSGIVLWFFTGAHLIPSTLVMSSASLFFYVYFMKVYPTHEYLRLGFFASSVDGRIHHEMAARYCPFSMFDVRSGFGTE